MSVSGAPMRWVPLESNPELYTSWAASMGLNADKFQFVDVYGLDDDLLAMVPQPVEAVLCLFPISDKYEAIRLQEDKDKPEFVGPEKEGELIWFKQTIGNACGTIGLLHSIVNTSARKTLAADSPMGQLLKDALPLTARQRADYLQTSKPLAHAHTEAAAGGQSAPPPADTPVDLHFTTFVRHPETHHLFELDGRRKGPVDRGVVVPDQHSLLKIATQWIHDNYMSLNPEDVNYNLVALASVE